MPKSMYKKNMSRFGIGEKGRLTDRQIRAMNWKPKAPKENPYKPKKKVKQMSWTGWMDRNNSPAVLREFDNYRFWQKREGRGPYRDRSWERKSLIDREGDVNRPYLHKDFKGFRKPWGM